jgi:hypothetical protein
MGVTNVIVRAVDGGQKLSYACIDEMLRVESSATIKCAGLCHSCEWWGPEALGSQPFQWSDDWDLDTDRNVQLVGYESIVSVWPHKETEPGLTSTRQRLRHRLPQMRTRTIKVRDNEIPQCNRAVPEPAVTKSGPIASVLAAMNMKLLNLTTIRILRIDRQDPGPLDTIARAK